MKTGLLTLMLFALPFGHIAAQNTSSDPLWIQYMLEPKPNYYKVKAAFDDYWKDSVPQKGFGYKVFKRWEWRALQHMEGNGDVIWPQGQLQSLLQGNSSVPNSGSVQQGGVSGSSLSACPANGRWNAVGPIRHPYNQTTQPTGIGRVAGVAFHPKDSNTFFICAPQGGVWKTTNNGATWQMLFGIAPAVNTIGTTSMVLSYNNPDTMYVGTGDRDAGDAPSYGVIASWNGGKTWVSRSSGMGNLAVGRLVMHPKNSAIMLAATNGGIYRTTNGGSSWSQTLSGGAWDVAYHPKNPNYAYASIGGAFYLSTNGGSSWSLITSGLPTSGTYRGMIAVTPADRGYVYFLITSSVVFQGLYLSTDSGSNFSTMSTTPNILGYSETGSDASGQGWYDLDIAADPKNKNTIYVGGINVWKSTNAGANWSINGHWVGSSADDIHADQHALEFNITGNKLYVGNDGGIYYTSNGGSRYVNISTGIQNSQIYRMAQAKTDPYAGAHGYQDNGSSQTTEDEFYTYYGGDGMDCQVDPGDHTYVYGSYVYGRIYRAINKNTIITLGANGTNGINENGGWLTPFVLREGSPAVMWAGYTNVWRCDNIKSTGTISWTRISSGWSGSISRLENSPKDNKILFVIRGDGRLFRTTDATVASPTWTDLSSTQPSGVRCIEASHRSANIVYACNASNLYRSTNQGASWTSLGTLPASSGNMNCLYLDTSAKTETIYIGSEKGVYVWDSLNNTIATFNTGFPVWADVTDLDIYYSPKGRSSSHVVASTYGMGVWRSNLYDDGLVLPKANMYAFDSVFVVGGKMRLYEKIQNSVSSVKWKITPYLYSYVEGTDSTSNNPVIQFSGSGLFTVRLAVSNCNGYDTMTKKYWVKVFPKSNNANCTNTTTWQSGNYGIGIMRIAFSDNKSETGGYFDDEQNLDLSSRKIFRVKPSTSYSTTIKTGAYNSEYVRLYFDYNNNGKFENYLGEVSTMPAAALGTRTFSFTTPSTLKVNIGMRMRVLSDFNSLDTNACKNLNYGQGEDYTLIFERTTPYFKVSKVTACTYENLTFTDTSEGLIALYEWDFGSGATPATAVGKGPHTVSYSTTGNKTVRLRINGADSLRKTNYINVGVGPVPQIVVKSGSLTGCEGRSITLAARATNGVSFSVQWQKNGSDLAGKTDTLLTLTNVLPSDVGAYRALLVNGGCTATSGAVSLVVDPKPAPGFNINTNPQCFNFHRFNYTNTSTVSSGSIASNTWRLGDGTTQTTSNAAKTYSAVGTYTVKLITVSDKNCRDSISKTVTVNTNATVKFTANDTDQCLSGNNFVFTNNASVPSGSLTYLWQFGDGNTSTATSPSKTYSSSGMYTVRLISTTNLGCKDSAIKSVRVYSKPAVLFGLNSSAQCLKGNNFTTSNLSLNVDGSMAYTWHWGDGGTSTTSAPTHKYGSYGAYTIKLIVTTSFGCKDSYSQSINVHPQAVVKYTVNDTDQCFNNHSFVFTNSSSVPSGSLTYLWEFGDGNTSGATNPTKSYTVSGTYLTRLITTTNNNCKDSFNKPVRVYALPTPGFNINNANQCLKGNAFTFTNTSSNTDGIPSYFWNYGNGTTPALHASSKYAVAGTYAIKLYATSSFGCKDSLIKNINVFPQTKIAFSVNDTDQCLSGNSFVFTNKSSISAGTANYNWNFGDNTSSTQFSPSKAYIFPGVYPLLVHSVSNSGCRDTAKSVMRVYAQPTMDFSISQTPQCLRGNQFLFTNNTTVLDAGFANIWQFKDGNTSNAKSPQYSYLTDGNFAVKLISITDFGCQDSMEKMVTVFPQVKPGFVTNDSDQCIAGNKFNFTNNSTLKTGVINNYNWRFGDGASSVLASPVHSYSSFGTYVVRLEVNSNGICKDTIEKSVRVYAQPVAVGSTLPGLSSCFNYNRFESESNSTIAEGSLTTTWDNGDGSGSTGNQNAHSYGSHGNYVLKMVSVSNFGCKDSVIRNLRVLPSPQAEFIMSKSVYCEGEDAVVALNSSTIASGQMSFAWDFANTTTSTDKEPKTQYAKFGQYNILLQVKSDSGCMDSFESVVTIASIPKPLFTIQPKVGCANQTNFSFESTSSNADGRSFQEHWNFNNGDTANGKLVQRVFDTARLYKIKLTTSGSYCSADTTMDLVVSPQVSAAFVYDFITKETARFRALDTQISGYTYVWNFGDGASGFGPKATHTYVSNSVFQPQLVVYNDKGCADTTGGGVVVQSPVNIDQDNALNFYVYPNPNLGKFTYKFKIDKPRTVVVKLYDIIGQGPLYEKTWTNLEPGIYFETVDLASMGFSPGTYPMSIISEGDKLVVKIIFTK